MPDYYLITSKLNGNVLTVANGNTAPVTPIVSMPPNASGSPSQLWALVPTGPKDSAGGQSQYFIQSQLNNFVLDINGGSTAPATPIINYPAKTSGTSNQVWQIIESNVEGAFYITSQLNNFVIDITGSNTAPGAPIISYPQNNPTSNNQLWTLVAATQSQANNGGGKKSAITGSKASAIPAIKSAAIPVNKAAAIPSAKKSALPPKQS